MLFLPLLLKGIGTAIGVGSQLGSANRAEQTADLNYSINRQNATIQRGEDRSARRIDRIRNRAELRNAETNYNLALAESEARRRNADRLRLYASAKTKQSRESIRRQLRDFEKFKSTQIATIGASGVAFEGSALDVLAETAGQMQIAIQDMHDQANFERSETLYAADLEDFGASLESNAAGATYRSAKSGFRLNKAAIKLGKISSDSRYNATLFGAEANRVESYDAAKGQRIGTVGQIFAGAGALAVGRDTYNRDIKTTYTATT